MKIIAIVLCLAAVFVSGCASGITRTGYKLPAGQTSKDLTRCVIAIQCDAKYDTNAVVVLGSIHAYDTGFSTDCDEAYVLDVFSREACALGADLINITEEKQPSVWTSSCYRARATFIRFNDREKAKSLISDAKYAPELVIDRSAKFSKRTKEVIAGAVLGGPLGAVIVGVATEPNSTNHVTAVTSPRASQK